MFNIIYDTTSRFRMQTTTFHLATAVSTCLQHIFVFLASYIRNTDLLFRNLVPHSSTTILYEVELYTHPYCEVFRIPNSVFRVPKAEFQVQNSDFRKIVPLNSYPKPKTQNLPRSTPTLNKTQNPKPKTLNSTFLLPKTQILPMYDL